MVARTQKLAKEIGLYGPDHLTKRRLVKNGSSLAVTLDAQLLEDVFGYRPNAGEEVVVGRQGAAILVEPAEGGASPPTRSQARGSAKRTRGTPRPRSAKKGKQHRRE